MLQRMRPHVPSRDPSRAEDLETKAGEVKTPSGYLITAARRELGGAGQGVKRVRA